MMLPFMLASVFLALVRLGLGYSVAQWTVVGDNVNSLTCYGVGICDSNITCPESGNCEISCTAAESCQESNVNKRKNNLNINLDMTCNVADSCNDANINCPNNGDTCEITCNGCQNSNFNDLNTIANDLLQTKSISLYCSNANTCQYSNLYCSPYGNCTIECSNTESCLGMTINKNTSGYGNSMTVYNNFQLNCLTTRSCKEIEAHCFDNDNECNINCGSESSCASGTFYCPRNGDCNIDCTGTSSCMNSKIYCPVDSGNCTINCESAAANCANMDVYCSTSHENFNTDADNFGNNFCNIIDCQESASTSCNVTWINYDNSGTNTGTGTETGTETNTDGDATSTMEPTSMTSTMGNTNTNANTMTNTNSNTNMNTNTNSVYSTTNSDNNNQDDTSTTQNGGNGGTVNNNNNNNNNEENNSDSNSSSGGLDGSMIAVIVLSIVLFLIIFGIVAYVIITKKQNALPEIEGKSNEKEFVIVHGSGVGMGLMKKGNQMPQKKPKMRGHVATVSTSFNQGNDPEAIVTPKMAYANEGRIEEMNLQGTTAAGPSMAVIDDDEDDAKNEQFESNDKQNEERDKNNDNENDNGGVLHEQNESDAETPGYLENGENFGQALANQQQIEDDVVMTDIIGHMQTAKGD